MDVPAMGGVCATRSRSLPTVFKAAYRQNFAFVWRSVVRLGVQWTEAEDAVQEVFLVAFRRWAEFQGRSSLRTWLFAIARRVASHHRRGTDRRRRRHWALQRASDWRVDGQAQAECRHAAARLRNFLDALDPDKREVFILADLEGFTGREVASALGIKPNTAWSRLRAARAEFARAFGHGSGRRPTVIVQEIAPPPQASRRVWALLVPNIPGAGLLPGATTGGGLLETWLASANAKAFALALAAGSATLGGVVAMAPPPPAAAPEAGDVVPEPPTSKTARRSPARPTPPAAQPRAVQPAATVAPQTAVVPLQRPSNLVQPRTHAAATPPRLPNPLEAPPIQTPELANGPPDAELRIIHRARGALESGQAQRALALAADHKRRYPKGNAAMVKLRELTTVEALCSLGRKPQALGLAQTFHRRYRDAAARRQIVAACGLGRRTAGSAAAPASAAKSKG